MSDIKSLLLWEKWRPKKMDDLILLPRIRKQFENGVTQNYIFHGHYGTGKTSLARILIGRYTKDKPFLELNSSLFTSIDVLRTEIENFCKTSSMMDTDSDIKYVFLDEFERVSIQFQDAFKAFIEKYNKNVRFIITTNHINKISDGIKSRISKVDFDCQSVDEEKYLKQEIYKRISSVILPSEGKEIPKQDLVSIITKKFPDFRSTILGVQSYIETGDTDSVGNVSVSTKIELYNLIYDKSYDYEKIYHYLMKTFGSEKIDIMIQLFGRQFIEWSINEKRENIEKLFKVSNIVCEYTMMLESEADPIIIGISFFGKLRDILI